MLIQNHPTDQFSNSQETCNLFSSAGDATFKVLESTLNDKFGNFTVSGLAALVRATSTCKYAKSIIVDTPIDANIVDISYNVPDDKNLNRQRFVLRALQKSNGEQAGARFRLISENANNDNDNDPFLLAFRDARSNFDRPVTVAIAKPTANGSLLCVELSIRELLLFFGGHSKKSVFAASKSFSMNLAKWEFNIKSENSTISVWGNSSSFVGLVDEDELEDDSLNPIELTAAPDRPGVTPVLTEGKNFEGKICHNMAIDVKFRFHSSKNCSEFSDAVYSLVEPAKVSAFFGCFETFENARVPSYRGSMISNSQRMVPPLRTTTHPRKNRIDRSIVSVENITNGRRAAVSHCDLRIQRLLREESLMDDGQYLPTHPMFAKIQEDLDETNEHLKDRGMPPIRDNRLSIQSPKRARSSQILIH